MAKKPTYEVLEHRLKVLGEEVSQHKQIDKALQQSEERYQILYRNTPAMLHSIDLQGRLIEVSDYWLKVMGYQRKEVIQRHLTDFMTEESGDFARRIVLPEFFDSGSVENVPYQLVTKNGTIMDTLLSAIAERDSKGKPIRSLAVVVDVTEQKQAEDALRMSERRYRLLADNVTDVIWTISMDRLITYVSPSIKHLLGYDVEEITLQTIEKVISPASYALVRKICEEEITIGKMPEKDPCSSIKVELELKHKNGSHIFTDTRMTFLRDSEGGSMTIVGSTRDITDRVQVEKELQQAHNELEQRVEERTFQLSESNDRLKKENIERIQTEKRLRRSEARLAEAQCIAHLGNWDWDIVNNDLWWSDEVYRIFGVKSQEFGSTYEAFLDYVHLDDREFVDKAVDESLSGNKPYSIDHRIILPDGTERIVHEQAGVIFDTSRRPIRMAGTVQDITDSKCAEEALVAERYRLLSLLEELPGFVYLQAPDYSIHFSNRYFREQFGESGGKRCYEVLGRRKEPCKNCRAFQVFETGMPQKWEWLEPHNKRTYQIYDYPFNDVDGSPLVLELGVDITERKEAEEALQESERELRHLSSQLITVQEEERKRIALELHDGIGQTLSAIKFKVETVLREMDQGNSGEVCKSLERLVPMIQEAVEETRIISANLRPSILDDLGILATISWLCREVESIYSLINIEKKIEIEEKDVPDSLKTVIYRILREALNNSAKYSRANLVHLSLKREGVYLYLTINDNGVGFNAEDVTFLESSKRRLGLTSMKERTELSGGAFFTTSQKGVGTTVRALWSVKGESKNTTLYGKLKHSLQSPSA